VDECKPLLVGLSFICTGAKLHKYLIAALALSIGRGLHSSTFRLNVSTFCRIR